MTAADPVRPADSVSSAGARHVAPPAAGQAGHLTLAQIP